MSSKNNIKKKKISKDCWNLDYSFYLWLKERLPVYVREGGKIIDLEYHKFSHRGKEYTQLEMIKKMQSLLCTLTSDESDSWDKEYEEADKELMEIWALVHRAMWW